MIAPIKSRLRRTDEIYLIHNTREACAILATAINTCIDKINEIVEVPNKESEVTK